MSLTHCSHPNCSDTFLIPQTVGGKVTWWCVAHAPDEARNVASQARHHNDGPPSPDAGVIHPRHIYDVPDRGHGDPWWWSPRQRQAVTCKGAVWVTSSDGKQVARSYSEAEAERRYLAMALKPIAEGIAGSEIDPATLGISPSRMDRAKHAKRRP